MRRLVLKKEDCYQSLVDFYDFIARLEGKLEEAVQYDARKICCTRGVQDEIFRFYEDKGCISAEIAALWLNCGPKANLETEDFVVTLEKGFFVT